MGFLAGLFWGAIVGGVALVVSSFALERQDLSLPQPSAGAVEVPGGSEFDQARPESEPVLPTQETVPEAAEVETVETPEETTDAPPELDTAALEVPEPDVEAPAPLGEAPEPEDTQSDIATDTAVEEALAEELETPEAPGDAPETVVAPAAPDAAEQEAAEQEAEVAAVAPVTDEQPSQDATDEPELAALPDAEPEQPDATALPEVTTGDTTPSLSQPEITEEQALPGAAADTEIAAIGESPEAPRLPQVTEEPSLPQAAPQPEPSVVADTAQEPEPAPEPELEPSVEADTAPEPEPVPEPEPAPEPAPEVAAPAAPEPETTSAAEPEPDTETAFIQGSGGAGTVRVDDGPSFLRQVDTLETQSDAADDTATATTTLPTVRRAGVAATDDVIPEPDAAPDAGSDVAPDAAPDGAETDNATDGPALQRFASAFENPEGSPVISVVLLHRGGAPLGADVLQALPAHVAFAVDANAANVSGTAQAYRDAGREVVLIPSLPEGAAPQDVEQAMQVNLTKVPEAVAIMDITGSNFQSDRAAVRQVVDVVLDTGHGLITFPRGLNTAHQEAQRANVPTGLIFRDVDGDGESQEQIRRTLDRAAFRARQDNGVILVGTTSEPTIAAIVEWALGNRAASVSIAPVSVALTGNAGG